ncbi:LysM peptidoglycan-binding domain-containing protein [Blastococcus sp. SYSU DS0973]
MSARRLVGTALGMAGIAAALAVLTPALPESFSAVGAAQRTADAAGADVLVLHVVGLLAWLVWAWGSLGLLLTALSAVPGAAGTVADGALGALLPRGARRAAALALGIGLGIAPPALGAAVTVLAATPAAASDDVPPTTSATGSPAPDWPVPPSATAATDDDHRDGDVVPDWPDVPAAGEHVVVRGDCLWEIAERRLAADSRRAPSAAEVTRAVQAWWAANADVIGPDPDRLLPGQVLRPPLQP